MLIRCLAIATTARDERGMTATWSDQTPTTACLPKLTSLRHSWGTAVGAYFWDLSYCILWDPAGQGVSNWWCSWETTKVWEASVHGRPSAICLFFADAASFPIVRLTQPPLQRHEKQVSLIIYHITILWWLVFDASVVDATLSGVFSNRQM